MDVRLLDLDGGLVCQQRLLERHQPAVLRVRDWGPRLRMACRFAAFHHFEKRLTALAGRAHDEPAVTFCGSGDFHHVSLALVRRIQTPLNILVLDNHPDWMRGIPFLHCGTWLHHASLLPHVQRIFHVGGDVDFDNAYRWLCPRRRLCDGRIVVMPSRRHFHGHPWRKIAHEPLRPDEATPVDEPRMRQLLQPWLRELASRPLYISLDKDVMQARDATVNWDSGYLSAAEVNLVLRTFLEAAQGKLASMDVVGDWSPVQLYGLGRRLLHLTEHPPLSVSQAEAITRNEAFNLELVELMASAISPLSVHEAA